MSECPPPGVVENTPFRRPEALTPEAIEHILGEFRAWLHDLARKSADATAPGALQEEDLEPIDLHSLLGQIVALRQEVHLQTRTVRAQQEQNTETLEQLTGALEVLRDQQSEGSEEPSEADEILRPVLKALIELYDALALATREVARVQENLRTLPEALPPASLPLAKGSDSEATVDRVELLLGLLREWEATSTRAHEKASAQPVGLLARWFGIGRAQREALAAEGEALAAEGKVVTALRESLAQQKHQLESARTELQQEERAEAERTRKLLDSILTGYTMSLQRVERALQQHDLDAIPCVGMPFDPERMEVLEVVNDTGRPSGEVIEEVRRGYLWRERVFRFAQVRVARS